MNSDNIPNISFATDGPCMVKGLKNLSNQHGSVECKETMALCRCGASANKPFCDGAHVKIGFSSSKLEDRIEDKRDTYSGVSITVFDNRSICAHAGYCTNGLADVFRMKQEPWIDPDAATIKEIIAIVNKCPSGALSYSINGVDQKEQSAEPTIFIAPNGPYVISGGASLLDSQAGEGALNEQYTLCRCGASKNKPYCDGSHWSIEFSDEKN